MGLIDQFLTGGTVFGSPFTNADNAATILDASTANSTLHYDASDTNGAGYSLSGLNSAGATVASQQYQQYDDGDCVNTLPVASILDINGANPIAPLADSNYAPLNNSFTQGTYRDTLNAQGVVYAGTF